MPLPKFDLDYKRLDQAISPEKQTYHLQDVQDQLEKVAFDIVRFKDADKGAQLWQVQEANDGQFIVALYQDEDGSVEKTASVKSQPSDWDVYPLTLSNSLQISYKGDPIAKLSVASLGIPKEQISKVHSYLPQKLASNPKLVSALLKDLPDTTRASVLKKYPELATRNV